MKRNDQRNKNLKPNRGSFTPSKQVLTDENCVPSFNCLQNQMKTERERDNAPCNFVCKTEKGLDQ